MLAKGTYSRCQVTIPRIHEQERSRFRHVFRQDSAELAFAQGLVGDGIGYLGNTRPRNCRFHGAVERRYLQTIPAIKNRVPEPLAPVLVTSSN